MIDFSNPDSFKDLDPKNVFESTGLLGEQAAQIWEDSSSLSFPAEYKNVKNIVVSGMGGSAYGGHVASSLFKDSLSVPLYVNNGYNLPEFVGEDSLVILTSYSGSTEEALSSAYDAIARKAKTIVFTGGGKLEQLSKDKNISSLIFNPKNNPSGQPRLGTGYIVVGTFAILEKLGLINVSEDVINAIDELGKNQEAIRKEASQTSVFLKDFIPVIFSSEFLTGNAHIIRNQFNETSKSFSSFSDLPELNHHLMEGLKNPENKNLKILFLSSEFYPEEIKKRIALTKEVISQNNVEHAEYLSQGSTQLSQVLNTLVYGGYLTFYLAILYGLDPSLIPWVDYFKERLTKGSS